MMVTGIRSQGGGRAGVILVTYGEPQRNGFGEQWMYSYRILDRLTRKIASIPRPLLPIIATARARGRVKLWKSHGFVSPLEPLHDRTVGALRAELVRRGYGEAVVTRAYEFRRPGLADALDELSGCGCRHALVVPMYIAGGDFTDGMTLLAVEDALRVRPAWSREQLSWCPLSGPEALTDRLAATLADHCTRAMARAGIATPARDWAVLLAAHGTVVTPPAGVDNGLLRFGRVLRRVRALLRPHVGLTRVGWLNHTRGGRWTSPSVAEALRFVKGRDFHKIVYFPWGFTTDNAETALEGRIALTEVSFSRVEHVECLNTGDPFVAYLADRVAESLAGRVPSPAVPWRQES